jgi:hypothetical protein
MIVAMIRWIRTDLTDLGTGGMRVSYVGLTQGARLGL